MVKGLDKKLNTKVTVTIKPQNSDQIIINKVSGRMRKAGCQDQEIFDFIHLAKNGAFQAAYKTVTIIYMKRVIREEG